MATFRQHPRHNDTHKHDHNKPLLMSWLIFAAFMRVCECTITPLQRMEQRDPGCICPPPIPPSPLTSPLHCCIRKPQTNLDLAVRHLLGMVERYLLHVYPALTNMPIHRRSIGRGTAEHFALRVWDGQHERTHAGSAHNTWADAPLAT